MAKQTLLTRALLACVAGPMYVMVTMAQALTRDGFDLRQHRFSWLTTGDLRLDPPVEHGAGRSSDGAVRGRRAPSAADGPGCGLRATAARAVRVAYIIGGLLTADPVAG